MNVDTDIRTLLGNPYEYTSKMSTDIATVCGTRSLVDRFCVLVPSLTAIWWTCPPSTVFVTTVSDSSCRPHLKEKVCRSSDTVCHDPSPLVYVLYVLGVKCTRMSIRIEKRRHWCLETITYPGFIFVLDVIEQRYLVKIARSMHSGYNGLFNLSETDTCALYGTPSHLLHFSLARQLRL